MTICKLVLFCMAMLFVLDQIEGDTRCIKPENDYFKGIAELNSYLDCMKTAIKSTRYGKRGYVPLIERLRPNNLKQEFEDLQYLFDMEKSDKLMEN